jgi:hypothetical protein
MLIGLLLLAVAGLALAVVLARPSSESAPPRPPSTGPGRQPSPHPAEPGRPGISPHIDDELEKLELAQVAFNAPTDLDLHEAAVIQLLLSGRRPIQELKSRLTALGKREGARVRASDSMEAQLAGTGFAIEALTPAVQLASHDGITEWRWEVEPTRSGMRRLHLTLSALVDVDGHESAYTVRVFERTLDVRVSLRDRLAGFVGDNWQWLWAALLVPLVGWLVRQRRKPAPL